MRKYKLGDKLQYITIEEEVGSGAFGTVYKGKMDDRTLAIKVTQSHYFDLREEWDNWVEVLYRPFIKEEDKRAASLLFLYEPYIVLAETCWTIGDENILTIEWVEGGNLSEWINSGKLYNGSDKEVSERIIRFASNAAKGLKYIHSKLMIHGDIKPSNIMIDTSYKAKNTIMGDILDEYPIARITDFGLSSINYQERNNFFTAPELVSQSTTTNKVDVYSWALTVLSMYLGETLSHKKIDTLLYLHSNNNVLIGEELLNYHGKIVIPCRIKLLLSKCLRSNPNERPDFDYIIDELITYTTEQHGFIPVKYEKKDYGFVKFYAKTVEQIASNNVNYTEILGKLASELLELALLFINKKDYDKAFYLFAILAQQGLIKAQLCLASCYLNAIGTNQDFSRASFWAHESLEKDYVNTKLLIKEIGDALLDVSEKNSKERTEENKMKMLHDFFFKEKGLLQNCIEKDADLLYLYGRYFIDGIILTKDISKGINLLTKSAMFGYKSAQFSLGLYYLGQYASRNNIDYFRAVHWLTKCADQGDIAAMLYLGDCYLKGNGVNACVNTAFSLWKKVARNSSSDKNSKLVADAAKDLLTKNRVCWE
ncbi:MAG: Sel1-like repeat-containing protein kinase family protein [Firmicutes bacterium]|nr:Sel1-like repeat-containing protein kinase family protein [Bacillota bacterium]